MPKLLLNLPPMLALAFAIIAEVIATSTMPKTQQFSQLIPSVVVVIGYSIAFILFSIVVKTVPVGIAYAIWSGAGIVIVAGISWFVYQQKLDFWAIVGISFIITGTLIVNLLSKSMAH